MARKVSKSGVLHDCEQCGKRAPWGPGWRHIHGPIESKHLGSKGQLMPVRWCSDACEDRWYAEYFATSAPHPAAAAPRRPAK